MRIRSKVSRLAAALLLAAFVPAATACFGGYNLTRNFYQWNKNISDSKWVVWLIHLPVLFVIWFPAMLDAVVFNSIEFHSGNNPINLGTFHGPGGVVAQLTPRDANTVDVLLTERSGDTHNVTLVRDDEVVRLFDAQGRLLATREL